MVTVFQIRSRGQAAFFAGVWLALFLPFFGIGALEPTGFTAAQHISFASKNYTSLLQWTHQHIALAIVYSLLEILPLLVIWRLPQTLRIVIHGENGGNIAQWMGIIGILIFAGFTLINAALLVGTAQIFAGANIAAQSSLGANFRITSINLSIITDVLGGGVLALWLWFTNFPLLRLAGLERFTGIGGLISAALFAATLALVVYDPQQTHQTLVGVTLGVFGIWLAVVGFLLMRRSILVGTDSPVGDAQFETLRQNETSDQIPSH